MPIPQPAGGGACCQSQPCGTAPGGASPIPATRVHQKMERCSPRTESGLLCPYLEDGFPDSGEVSHILVYHLTRAVHQLGPRQPLARRQLHIQGLKQTQDMGHLRLQPALTSRPSLLLPALHKEAGGPTTSAESEQSLAVHPAEPASAPLERSLCPGSFSRNSPCLWHSDVYVPYTVCLSGAWVDVQGIIALFVHDVHFKGIG